MSATSASSKSEQTAFADNDQLSAYVSAASVIREDPGLSTFSTYRADQVSMTSALLSGGDWHWRLTASSGAILADCGGYHREGDCLAVINALRTNAHTARLSFHH